MFTQNSPVEIRRDSAGVPHVYAEDVPHAYFGYGYIAAVDRLFQLEMRRRQAKGEVAEVLGPIALTDRAPRGIDMVALDKAMRRDYDEDDLMYQFGTLDSEQKAILEAWLAGLNHRIREVKGAKQSEIAPQFTEFWGPDLIGHALNEWTLPDLLAATSNALTSYVRNTTSQENQAIHDKLAAQNKDTAAAIFDTLLWINDPHAPTTMGNYETLAVNPRVPLRTTAAPTGAPSHQPPPAPSHAAAVLTTEAADAIGHSATTSMAILVGGDKHVADGNKSIQLNGPQPGWFQPSYFYTIGLHAKNYDVVGHAPGALIAITTGQNSKIAWGSTSAGGDHTTIFKENLDGLDKAHRAGGGSNTVTTDTATIKVRHGESQTIKIRRVWTGPVNIKSAPRQYRTLISETPAGNFSKQVLWRGHELTSVMAWERATRATDWNGFSAEAASMALGYNWFYSDTAGNIGWLFNGYFPTAEENHRHNQKAPDSRLPRDATQYAPVQYRSYADIYRLYNPECGYIINWNNKPHPDYDNRDLQFPRWSQGDRTNILLDLMRSHSKNGANKFSGDDIHAIYRTATEQDVNYYHFAPAFDKLTREKAAYPQDQIIQKALHLLQSWDGSRVPEQGNPSRYAGAAVPIFQGWLTRFVSAAITPLFQGDLAKLSAPYTGTLQLAFMKSSVNLAMGTKITLHALQFALGLRKDAPTHPIFANETAALKAMADALAATVKALSASGGQNPDAWRQAMVPQEFFADNYENVTTGFGDKNKNALPVSANRGSMQRLAVAGVNGMHVQDANPPGASEIPASHYFNNQLDTYGRWDFKDLPLNVGANSKDILVLHPVGAKL